MSRRLLQRLAWAALALATAQVASACPVCFDAEDEARVAYQLGAAMMTFLPLGLMGGAALYLRRRMKQRDLDASLPEHD